MMSRSNLYYRVIVSSYRVILTRGGVSRASSLKKVLMIGWDGAPYTLIHELLTEERLPNLQRVVAEGVITPLQTVPYVMSPSAWSSMVTGKNAGKHGIFDFYGSELDPNYFRKPINSLALCEPTFWDVMGLYGRKVGLINLPLTYPAKELNGFMVAGMLTPHVRDPFFTYPSTLLEDYARRDQYIIDVEDDKQAPREHFIQAIINMIEARTDLILHLITHHPVDTLFAVFTAPDRVQHWFWHFLDPTHPYLKHEDAATQQLYRDTIPRIYELLDAKLGIIRRRFEETTGSEVSMLVVSDHGMTSLQRIFDVNRYLASRGYLTFKPVETWTSLRHDILAKHVNYIYGKVDWSHTKAYSIGKRGAIYINLKGREPQGIVEEEEYDQLVNQLLDDFTRLDIIDKSYARHDLFYGKHLHQAPDILIFLHKGCFPFGYIFLGETQLIMTNDTKTSPFVSGIEYGDGIFCLSDPDLSPPHNSPLHPRVQDVAPTLLYLCDLPSLSDMDGTIFINLGKPTPNRHEERHYDEKELHVLQTNSQQRSAQSKNTETQKDALIMKRLQALGYH